MQAADGADLLYMVGSFFFYSGGWSSIVDAVFFSPEDVGYKSFADARREALRSSKHGN